MSGGIGNVSTSTSESSHHILCLRSLEVEQLKPRGVTPLPRGYHTFHTVGHRCYSIAGRHAGSKLLTDKDMLAVYDAKTNAWIPTPTISGTALPPRSSHTGVVVDGDKIVIFGGAGKEQQRYADTHVLHVSSCQMSWRRILAPPFPTGLSNVLDALPPCCLQHVTTHAYPLI